MKEQCVHIHLDVSTEMHPNILTKMRQWPSGRVFVSRTQDRGFKSSAGPDQGHNIWYSVKHSAK